MKSPDSHKPEEHRDHRRLNSRDEMRDSIASLLQQAQRQFVIFGPYLDAHLFNGARLETLVGEFIARSRDNRLRILVEDSRSSLLDNARLRHLAHRLPDCVRIRQVSDRHLGMRDVFVVADHTGYFHQPDVDRPDSITSAHAPREAVNLARRFDQLWEDSEPAQDLGKLGL